jgi:hypothetical protein
MTGPIPSRVRLAIGIIAVVLVDAGLILTQLTFHGGTLAQWNQLCGQGLGATFGLTSTDCALARNADHAIGWLIGEGLILLALYAFLRIPRAGASLVRSSG